MSGVFAVNRDVWEHPMFAPEPFTEREAWIWMCGAAAYKPMRARCGRAVVALERGQLAFATRFLARKWKWSEARVRRFLNRLETDAAVTLQPTRETTLITICNYDKHQFSRRADDAPDDALTDAPATHPRRKEEEVNKERKKKEEKKDTGKKLLPDDWVIKPSHYEIGLKKNLTSSEVEEAAAEMKAWSLGNGERRAHWDWVFNNWLGRNAERKGKRNGFGGPRPLQDDSRSISRAAGRLAEAAERGEFSFGPRPSLLPATDQTVVQLLPKGRGA